MDGFAKSVRASPAEQTGTLALVETLKHLLNAHAYGTIYVLNLVFCTRTLELANENCTLLKKKKKKNHILCRTANSLCIHLFGTPETIRIEPIHSRSHTSPIVIHSPEIHMHAGKERIVLAPQK